MDDASVVVIVERVVGSAMLATRSAVSPRLRASVRTIAGRLFVYVCELPTNRMLCVPGSRGTL